MTVTTPDRSVVLNTSGLPAEEGSARRHAPAEADPQGRHRASAPMEGGTGHHAGSPVAPASEAGFQSYSMFSGSRPANAVPVYRSATGHGAGARPGATGAGGPSTPRREPARAPRRTPSPGRVVRPAAVKGPGSQRPSAAPDRATTSSTPQARPVAPRSGASGASSTGSPAPDPRPATPPRPAAARPATPPPAGTAPAASPTAPGGGTCIRHRGGAQRPASRRGADPPHRYGAVDADGVPEGDRRIGRELGISAFRGFHRGASRGSEGRHAGRLPCLGPGGPRFPTGPRCRPRRARAVRGAVRAVLGNGSDRGVRNLSGLRRLDDRRVPDAVARSGVRRRASSSCLRAGHPFGVVGRDHWSCRYPPFAGLGGRLREQRDPVPGGRRRPAGGCDGCS